MNLMVLQYKFPVFGGLDEFVHVVEKLLRGDTGIYLCGHDVGMAQHTADTLNRDTLLQRDKRCERVAGLMVAQVFLDVGQQGKPFHVSAKVGMVHHGKQRLAVVVVILVNKRNGFGQEFHAGRVYVLLASVLQPECTLVVRIKVLSCDGNRISVCRTRIAGKEE